MLKNSIQRATLIKATLLLAALAGVSTVIYLAMHSLQARTGATGQTPTFFEQFVVSGGPIVWFVLLPLSLVAVYLAVEHALTIRKRLLLPEGTGTELAAMIRQFGLDRLGDRLAGRSDLVGTAVARAVGSGRADWFRIRNLLAESLQDQAAALMRRIEWLNLIGNVSPMVGLFGTVYGMIKLFNAIVSAGGDPRTVQLADGISVALVTTFWGLFIAIPAVALHGLFRNRIEALVNDAAVEAEDLLPVLRLAAERQKTARSGVTRPGPVAVSTPRKPTGPVVPAR